MYWLDRILFIVMYAFNLLRVIMSFLACLILVAAAYDAYLRPSYIRKQLSKLRRTRNLYDANHTRDPSEDRSSEEIIEQVKEQLIQTEPSK